MPVDSLPFDYTKQETELYDLQTDQTKYLIEQIIRKEPTYFHDLYKIVNESGGIPSDLLAQIVEIKYQMLINKKTEEEAQQIALETAKRIVEGKNLLPDSNIQEVETILLKNVLNYDEKQQLKAILTKYFPNREISKNCRKSNPLFGSKDVTTDSCCLELYERITRAVNHIKNFLRTKTFNLNEITLTDIAPSLPRYTIEMEDPTNFFKYLKKCLDEHRITDTNLLIFGYDIQWLARFLDMEPQWLSVFNKQSQPNPLLPIPPEPEPNPTLESQDLKSPVQSGLREPYYQIVGGYSKNKYHRASKKYRKSHRRRRHHRRSSRNKKHHTKRHTKRYRNRK